MVFAATVTDRLVPQTNRAFDSGTFELAIRGDGMSDQITGPGGVNVEEPAPKEPYVSANGHRRSTSKIVRRYIGVAAIAVAIVVIALALPSKSPKTVSGLAALGANGTSSANGGVASAAKGASGGKIGSGYDRQRHEVHP